MPGTLASPSTREPVKALGFYSFKVDINDDDYYEFPEKRGHLFVSSRGSRFHHGCFQIISGVAIEAFSGDKTAVETGALNGTTGADGNTSVSTDGTSTYIENRSGVSQRYLVTLIGGSP